MTFWSQTWTLTKKDLLLVGRRSWFTTIGRAVILPILFTFVVSYVKVWVSTKGHYGVGTPSPVMSLPEAFKYSASTRNRFVVVNQAGNTNDVQRVTNELISTFQDAKKETHVVRDRSALLHLCPSSSRGVSPCFGAVEFHNSPEQGGIWKYTLYQDGDIGQTMDVLSSTNPIQVYTIPLQHAIDAAISKTTGGPLLQTVVEYPFTIVTEAEKQRASTYFYETMVNEILAFAFFIGLCGVTYHLTGHITRQREQGMLQLIDAMMPNSKRWQCLVARNLSAHLAFDLMYLPGWIVMGGVTSVLAFPETNTGWLILIYVLAGISLTGFSLLASSLFRRAQLSAISTVLVVVVLAIVAQFAEGNRTPANLIGVLVTAALFTPNAFVYFLINVACFEQDGNPLDIAQPTPNNMYWSVPAYVFVGCIVLQIVVYPILGAIIESWLHRTSSRSRHVRSGRDMDGNAIRLRNFSKQYKGALRERDRTKAVKDLCLDIHAGSLTVLLGANGSGKSTTLGAISGLESITSGHIEVDGTGGIGLCPQKNVLWDAMTVEEHVYFFQRLKWPSLPIPQSRQEARRLVHGCDLEIKRDARAKTLSGGQMRKLQLAMMLAGGSRVCCIDEASSGIDPLARRKIWDILLNERGDRTMLLTTHFLDESEVLADHVAILSKGRLKAEGSVASLKNKLGGGYRIILPKDERDDRVPAIVRSNPDIIHRQGYNESVFEVPDAMILTSFINRLEQSGVGDYRVQGPAMEDVFLRLAEEMKDEEIAEKRHTSVNYSRRVSARPITSSSLSPDATPLKLNTGRGCGPIKQTAVLFLKRLTVLKHNFMPYVAAMFLPLVLCALVTRWIIHSPWPDGLPCSDPSLQENSNSYYAYPEHLHLDKFAYGGVSEDHLRSLFPAHAVNWGQSVSLNYEFEFNLLVQKVSNSYGYGAGGFFLGDPNSTFSWAFDTYGIGETAVFTQGTIDMALMNTPIALSYNVFATAWKPGDFYEGLVAVFTLLGFSVYPGFFALYPTAERTRKVRAMHYSNGILSSSLWAAYALFDLMFVIIISVCATVIWSTQYNGWYGLEYVFVVFLLYGMAGTAFSYVISLFVPSQLAAMAATSLVQTAMAMLFFLGYYATTQLALTTQLYTWFNYIYYTTALVCPAISLFRSLLITLNVYGLACDGLNRGPYPGDISLFGGPILYLVVQFILLVAFLIFWESGRSLEIFGLRVGKRDTEDLVDQQHSSRVNPDAMEDASHLSSSNDGLRVLNVSKTFGSNKAVNDVSFGILPSERFALLGPNGAGKSTTISLIRGELRPDSTRPPGNIFIASDSLVHTPVAARNHLGVCPQFDAVDSMTLSEHLHFYARARGVPDKDTNIRELISRLGLYDHRNKLVKKLSGGTKRKLSLAIAMIANPSVLLLDEPSSGMDAAAKRALWATLFSVASGRCLLLTTHSMEEADALCDRAGIMAGKMLALGTITSLRAKHGDKMYIHLVHKDAPHTSASDAEAMWHWVMSTFRVAETERRSFGGQIRFAVPSHSASDSSQGLLHGTHLGRLFHTIEQNKASVGIRDYSIGPTTLDQVFLNVVSKHNVEEENTDHARPNRWLSWFNRRRIFR